MNGTVSLGSSPQVTQISHDVTPTNTAPVQEQARPTEVLGQTIPRAPGEARQQTQQELPLAPPLAQRTATPELSRAQKVLEPLLSGLRNIGHAIAKVFERPQSLPQTLCMVMPPNGTPFSLDTKCLPSTLPKGMSVGAFQTQLQSKIFQGHQLIQDLTNGRVPNRTCNVEDMTNIMWCLQVQGEMKVGQSFEQGAFSIPDPNGRILQFLDSCPEAYQRESSHIEDIQRHPGCKHRGIDASGSNAKLDQLLPHGMQTLLYGKLPKDEAQLPEQRLFMKIEEHGCFLSKPKGGRDADGPGRAYNRYDLGAFLGHVGTTIPSLLRKLSGKGEGEGTFKERLSPELKNGYQSLMQNMHEEVKGILNFGKPLSTSGGVRVMLDNINTVLGNEYLKVSPEQRMQLAQFKAEYLSGHHGVDHPESRFGDEVVFSTRELSEGVQTVRPTSCHAVSGNFSQDWARLLNESLRTDIEKDNRVGREGGSEVYTPSGISRRFERDLPRADYKFDGRPVKSMSEVEAFFSSGSGMPRTNDAKVVTSLVQQDFMNALIMEVLPRNAPVNGSLLFANQHQHYDTSRLPNGDYQVSFEFRSHPNVLTPTQVQGSELQTFELRMLDPNKSFFNLSGSCVIRPGQNPVLIFDQPPTYSMKLIDAQPDT